MYLKTFDEMRKTSTFFMLKPANVIYSFIIIVFVSIFAILIWAIFAPMDETVRADVLLRPNSAISSVKCVTSGQIFSKNFKNDDFIKQGDFLFSLDTTIYQTELESYKKELTKNENDIFANEILLKTIERLENGIKQKIEKNSDVSVKANSYIAEFYCYQTELDEAKTKLEREQNAPEMIKIPQNIEDLQNELTKIQLGFESWKINQKITALETKKSLETTKNTIENHITELERIIKNSTIYAPISGKIFEITKLNIGDYLFNGEEVLRIIPQNDKKLKAEIYVEPDSIAKVKVDDSVKIRFSQLPPSRYGMIETKVAIVSPDVTYLNGNAVFIVEAQMDSPYLTTKSGQKIKLIPGITAKAKIIIDKSTVLQMVMKKLDFIN